MEEIIHTASGTYYEPSEEEQRPLTDMIFCRMRTVSKSRTKPIRTLVQDFFVLTHAFLDYVSRVRLLVLKAGLS